MTATSRPHQALIVVGDRLLIQLDEEEQRTEVGLYLPASVQSKEDVQGGRVVQVGQGVPMVDPSSIVEAPWKSKEVGLRYIPVQAQEGDYALFLKKAAVEIRFEGQEFLIVPQSAVLILVREEEETPLA